MKKIMSNIKEQIANCIDSIYTLLKSDIREVIPKIERVCRFTCVMSLIMAVLTIFHISSTLKSTEYNYYTMQSSINLIGNEYRSNLVEDAYKRAELHSKALRDNITNSIEREYQGNTTKLAEDLHSYLSKNDINNTLYKIFHKEVYDYVDHWFQHRIDVRIIIADKRKILFTSNIAEPFRQQETVPSLIFNFPYNEVLSCKGDDPESLSSLPIEDLSKDINRLEHLVLIAPSYIYEHKDLLGVGDVYPDGTPIDNDKLAVVIAFKPITSDHIAVIRRIQNEVNFNRVNGFNTIIDKGVSGGSIWLGLALFSGVIWYFIDIRKGKEESEKGDE